MFGQNGYLMMPTNPAGWKSMQQEHNHAFGVATLDIMKFHTLNIKKC